MTIDEAVKILEQERKDHHSFRTDVIGQAEALGIEALKRIKKDRHFSGIRSTKPLPGETED